MIRSYRSSDFLMLIACVALATAGCARQEAPPTKATEVILPGEDQLTPPVVAAAPSAEAESSQPAAPAETAVAKASPATAEATTPEPVPTQPAPAATETPAAVATPVAASTPAATESTGGEFAGFKGRVTVDGPVPALPPLKTAGDPSVQDKVCVAKAIPDDSLVMGADGGLADVFVYAKKLPSGVKAPPPPTDPIVLDQQGCRFVPQAMIFRAGQPLLMKNSDPVSHNVRTTALSMAINQIVPPNDSTGIAVTYKKAERMPVQTKCDIHAWMLAYHFPLDHPYAAVTDANGNFSIPDLPPGDWEFVVWHGKVGNIERSFKFKATAGQTLTQDFSVPAAKLSQ